jgi:predicted amidohydrolase YtcJ
MSASLGLFRITRESSRSSLTRKALVLTISSSALILAACSDENEAPQVPAQLVYKNGSVVTLDDNNTLAQAVAVRDGKIVKIGNNRSMEAYVGSTTKVVDLKGKTLIPGIYDAHSHFTLSGTNELFDVNLNSVPIGPVETMAQLLSLLQTQKAKVAATDWVSGWGYDDTLIAEKRHPTRADLDTVSATQPIIITHVSGHFAVANSAALALAHITAATPNPTGGTIRRDANGQPNGVLEETAVQMVSTLKPAFTAAQMQAGIAAASKQYASQGVTTANEGATYAPAVAALETAAQSGVLPIRVIAWPVFDYMAGVDKLQLTSGKVKVGGVKDFSDGSIQGYTGYLSHPYHTPFNGDVNYHGAPRIVRDVLAQRVLQVHKAGKQSFIHGNGDEAISDILFAYRNAQQTLPRPDARHTIIHSQMGTEAQLDEMKSLGVIPSFFVLHTYYWGDRHRDIFLGPERAARISPTKSALNRGMRFTIHTDTPVVPMEPMRLVWSAVNRVTTSGAVIGPEQRISPVDALRATTINAAYQNFEEKERGSIEVGKFADLVVLSANPLEVDPMAIKDIKVVETVVEGKSVYTAP